jgi:pilus assembly protein Flp/PilA
MSGADFRMVDGAERRRTVSASGADRFSRIASRGRPGGSLPEREVIIAVFMLLQAILARIVPRSDEDGQGLAEYALILALIAVVAIVALLFLGSQVSDKLSIIGNAV